MLRQAFVLCILVWGIRGDYFNDLSFLEWDQPSIFSGRNAASSSESLERDREPLSPDFQDPNPQSTEDKPVTAVPASGSTEKPSDTPVLNPKKETLVPKHPPINSFLPGGIINVDANSGGIPSFSSPFGPEFDFPALPGLPGLDRPISGIGIGGLFGMDSGSRWWKGKNVCIEREESTDDEKDEDKEDSEAAKNKTETSTEVSSREPNFFSTSIRLSNCFETENKYECVTRINNHGVVKTFTVRYKCCYGFKRTSDGCTKQVDLKPVLKTLDDLKLDEFRGMIKSTSLDSTFESGNFTIFAPNDDAVHDYSDKLSDINTVYPARRRRAIKNALTSKDLVLSHTVDGFVELADLENEQILQSKDDQKSTIRINIYPTHTYEKMMTANCARVKKGNVLADNGIIHIVDRVVLATSESVEDIIKNNPKLSSFRKALDNTDIPKKFKPTGHYTIFAATDEAFSKLDEIQRQKILNGGGCASNILKHHIVAHTVCSSAIIGNATTHNVEGAVLNMERTMEDELIFEGKAKITQADIVGTNGVVHLIDTLIIPESGQYIGSVLKAHNYSKFQDLVQKAGLIDELNNFDNATVFVPVDAAFDNADTKKLLEELATNQEKLKELVRYHVADKQVESNDMSNNMMIPTNDQEKELRVNLYSTLPLFTNVINRATINCARLIGFDEKTCGSIVHEVSRVLVPPSSNIIEIIETDKKYSTLRDLLKGTEVEKILQENNRSITFLAPSDEAFAALEEKHRTMLKENKEKANEILKNHVLSEVLCCSGVGPHTWGFNSFVPTLGDQRVEIGRLGNQIRVNRATITSCDTMAVNGVLHTINRVLAPRKRPVTAMEGGILFFDL
ncbi:transforming growth factor-beta-induced protein ig-h3 [Euwallacea fornicatus]|uniref:transforming growth factor-beta-induced protein ig-h3 n=1 Tax=Euwallacea fornicatus TaxID=995702 RepID=UPI00338D3E63